MFTLNNWKDDEYESILSSECQFLIVGKEVGESGTPHLQGYCELNNGKSLSAIKKMKGFERAHVEARKGTAEQARDYCMKDGSYESIGTMKTQGKRTDLQVVIDGVIAGKEDYEIVPELTSIQAVKSIDTVRAKLIKPRDRNEKPCCIWLYGDTGCGKSRAVKEVFNDYDDCHFENGFLIGYTGKDVVVFDDYRGSVPLNILLKMLDYGKCTVNIKGGSCFFSAKVVVFTAPFKPESVYSKVRDENLKQLIRRFDGQIWNCTEVNYPEVGGNTRPRLQGEKEGSKDFAT